MICSVVYVVQLPIIADMIGKANNEATVIQVANQLVGSEYSLKEQVHPSALETPVWLEKTSDLELDDKKIAKFEKQILNEEFRRFETNSFVKVKAVDLQTNKSYTNSENFAFPNIDRMSKKDKEKYTVVKLTYNDKGELSIAGAYVNADVENHLTYTFEEERQYALSALYDEGIVQGITYDDGVYNDYEQNLIYDNYKLNPVTNLEITYVIPNDLTTQYLKGNIDIYDNEKWHEVGFFNRYDANSSLYIMVGLLVGAVVGLIMLMLPIKKVREIQPYKIITKLPIEPVLVGVCFIFFAVLGMLGEVIKSMQAGILINGFIWDGRILYFGLVFVLEATLLWLCSICAFIVKYAITNFKIYIMQQSLMTRIFKWVFTLSFSPRGSVAIISFFFVNLFIVIFGISNYGSKLGLVIVLYVIFSIAMIYVLNRASINYQKVLDQSKSVSEGNFTSEPLGDVQPFNEISKQLSTINEGFKFAVEEEVKSQKMKTELITNVSHDLKTPLTAIISYVDLLKKEPMDPTVKSYVDVLDRNSNRLKRLIEDLFEVSKADSGNVDLQLDKIDVVSLLNQTLIETKDDKNDHLDLRVTCSSEHIYAKLDANKMYRVFENLLHNIYKYALPNTRVYIDVEEKEQVQITFKNISQQELDFDANQLTNRFVQGDESRNQEGSGLGLAIVKSFVELQGGEINITADGDLFKVELSFAKF